MFKNLETLFKVTPGRQIRLKDFDPEWDGDPGGRHSGHGDLKQRAKESLVRSLKQLSRAQEHLYANDVYSVLIVLQALDAAGKDGIIKHVMSGINPQGCQVFSFKRPSDEELDHNFLWRYSRCLPERGRIGIFNRSYYEEVLVVRVHPEILARQRLPPGKSGRSFWERRFDEINDFERHLARNGTAIVKFFLNVSKREQKKRFLQRLDDPDKHWKFSAADLAERSFWGQYRVAYEEMLNATSTTAAPWWVIPADNKWVSRALVGQVVTQEIAKLGLAPPALSKSQKAELSKARQALIAER